MDAAGVRYGYGSATVVPSGVKPSTLEYFTALELGCPAINGLQFQTIPKPFQRVLNSMLRPTYHYYYRLLNDLIGFDRR